MLGNIKELRESKYDFLTFLEGEQEGTVSIMGSDYNDPGEKIGGSQMGDSYHIILFRDHKTEKDKYDDMDKFEAILCDPIEYVSGLIKCGWFGVVARRTTTSENIINKLVAKFEEMN